MRKKRKIKWKKGLAVVLAATVTAVSTVSGNGKSIFTVYAATEGENTETGTTESTGENTSEKRLEVTSKGAISCGEDKSENGPKYTFDENGVLTLHGSGKVDSFKGYTNIKKVIIENGITELSTNCFENCSGIIEVDLSLSELQKLPYKCFGQCTNLESIYIPESVTSIDSYSFDGCKSLKYIYYQGSEESWNEISKNHISNYFVNAQKNYGKSILIFNYNADNGESLVGKDGTNISTEQIEKPANDNIDLTADEIPRAKKGNWEFVGWNTDSSAKKALSTFFVKESKIELYPIFKKSLTATFNNDNNTKNEIGYIYNNETESKIEVPELENKTSEGWTAVGWSASIENTNNIIYPGTTIPISRNITYYAVYKQSISISYKAGEGMSDVILPQDSKITRYRIGTEIITEPFTLAKEVKKQGYKFSNWQDKQGNNHRAADTITIGTNDTNEVFTAIWEKEKAIAPTIVTQPENVEVVYGYENASMKIKAIADNGTEYTLNYQWYKNTLNSDQGGTLIPNATLNTLLLEDKSPGTYYYYCEVTATRENGEIKTVTSDVAKFTVKKAERVITIGNLDKIFDNEPIDNIDSKVKSEPAFEGELQYKYYKDDNGKIGELLSSQTVPSEPGIYWIEVIIEADGDYKAASASRKFTINYLPTPEKPYILKIGDQEITTNKEWYNNGGDIIILPPSDNYMIVKDNYKNEFNSSITLSEVEGRHTVNFYLQQKETDGITDKISIPINIDTTNPEGVIEIQQKNSWNKLHTISDNDNKYFKEAQNVTISGTDKESGVDTISYFCSSEEYTEKTIKDVNETKWKKYEGTFPLTPEADYIIYARITDKAGNSVYLNSNKLIFESTKPVITGISNSGTYYGDVSFKVTDTSGIKNIYLGSIDLMDDNQYDDNGKCKILNKNESNEVECEITRINSDSHEYKISLVGNKNIYSYSIRAIDTAGNEELINKFTICKKFTVTFKDGDTEIKKQEVNYNQQVVAPEALPKKEGYSLVGWNKKIDETETEFNLNTPITEDNLILVPRWKANSYQVQFDSRGGSVCSNRTVEYDKTFNVMQEPSRSGYVFVGWYPIASPTEEEQKQELQKYENASTTIGKITETTKVTPNTDDIITLYAVWTPKEYTITFLSEGGIITLPNTESENVAEKYNKKIKYNETYGNLPKAVRSGYNFAGWYTDKTSGNEINTTDTYTNDGNTTLYAHWTEATFDVTLEYYTGHEVSDTEPDKIKVTYNGTYKNIPKTVPKRTGYTFKGWYDQEVGGEQVTKNTKVEVTDNNTKLYAQWENNQYTISFDANGGSVELEKKNVIYDKTYGDLPTPTKEGYKFVGWVLKGEGETEEIITANSTLTYAKDITLTAKWEAKTYTVTFDPDGGSVSPTTKNVKYTTEYGNLPTPTKEGYKFVEWVLKGEGETEETITVDSTLDYAKDVTLTAKWEAKTYTVTFDPDGGSVSPTAKDVKYNEKYGDLPIPTKKGYKFNRWVLKEGEAEETITVDSTLDYAKNVTLTAKWEVCHYTITLDANQGSWNSESGVIKTKTKEVVYEQLYDDSAMSPENIGEAPERKGYTFKGWFTADEGGTQIKGDTIVDTDADGLILYARWEANELDFNNGDLSSEIALQDAEYGKEYQVTIGEPENGTGAYKYELKDSVLPKGLSLVENRIEGVLEESIGMVENPSGENTDTTRRKVPFTIKITDINSGAEIKPKFTIQLVKGTPEKPQPPQVISRTSKNITLKEIEGAVYGVIEASQAASTDIRWNTSATIDGLEKGTAYNFYIKLKENKNYMESSVSEKIEVKTLNIYNITLPSSQDHYTITPVPGSQGWLGESQIEEGGSYSFKIKFDEGYNKKLDFAVYATANVNGTEKRQKLTSDFEGIYTIKNITEDKAIEIGGVGDSVYPTGTIEFEGTDGSTWNSFEKNITYSKFYNKNTIPSITIQGNDAEEGIKSISYYVGTEKEIFTESQVYAGKDNFNWKTSSPSTEGAKNDTVSVDLEDKEGKLVIYAKIEDKGGNITYLRSQGFIIDTISPTIQPVEITGDGSTGTTIYETENTEIPFLIQDEYLKDVTMDGKPFYSFGGKYFVPADGKEHIIVARDEAGNETTHKVQVKVEECTVTFRSGGNAGDTVVSVPYNQKVPKPTDPEKDKGIFYGWFLDGVEFDFSKPIKENITLIAKWLETGNASITAPEGLQVSATQVVLKQEKGYKYCMNDGEPTETPIFKGLTPGKEYCFYKIDEKGNKSAPLKITTETTAATGMMALPSTLYQGKAYNITPTIAMEGLVNKSADPENTEIVWIVNKPEIVSITNQSTEGCTLSINQVPYNKNRLTKVTLTATVVYSEMKQGNLVSKTRSYRKSFNVQNLSKDVSIDLSGFSTEPTDTGAFVSGSAICLMDKKGVSLKTMINLGAEGNIATNQKLKWFISDENGKTNRKGKKIASVNGKGVVKGIRPGTTYVTVATADSYDKSTKSYKVFKTCQIICPWVTTISFDSNVEKTVQAGSTLDLASALQCNPENLFNKQKMAKRWKSSDTKVARVTSKGIVTFKKAGTVTITCTPTGGQEIDATTGKVSNTAKNMAAEITFTVQ